MRRADVNPPAPLLWAAVCFAGGIALARIAWRPPLWWMLAAIAMIGGALMLLRRRPGAAFAVTLLALVPIGALNFGGRNALAPATNLAALDDQKVVVEGVVVRDAALFLPGTASERQSFDLQATAITLLNAEANTALPLPANTGMRVSLYSRDRFDEENDDASEAPAVYRYGQRLRVPARLRLPRNFGNPGAFDYRQYLADRGITALLSARADQVEVLPGEAGTFAGRARSRIRGSILRHTAALWAPRDAAMLDAMLVSERAQLTSESRLLFQRTGIYHLLVVAGLHLGIVAAFVFWSVRRLRAGETLATFITLTAAVGYAWLADDGAPIWRATLMLAVYMAARLLYRDRAALNAVGAAALVLLALDPQQLFGASLQLSFVAVLSIVAIAVPVIERTSAPYRRALGNLDAFALDLTLAPKLAQFRLDLRLIAQRLARITRLAPAQASGVVTTGARVALRGYDLLVISAFMQLALALPMAYYFHRAVTFGVLANVLAVPLAGMMLPLAMMAVALSYGAAWLARPFAWLAAFCLHAVEGAAGSLAAFRAADVRLATPATATLVAGALVLVLAALAMRLPRRFALAGAVGMLAGALWIGVVQPTPQTRAGVLEITALDVGQGDALLVVTPAGRTLLIDAGGPMGPTTSEFDYGEEIVSPYLWSRGLARLDAVALTHAHRDHLGGLRAVIANFHPAELWLGRNPMVPELEAALREAARQGVQVRTRTSGEAFEFGGMHVDVLAPATDWRLAPRPRNNDSLVLKVALGATAALLPGDAERSLERQLAQQNVASDLLKVAHHGSATSTTPELLAAAHPRYAVISSGAHNPFGHPRADVLSRLGAAHVVTFRTDTLGAVTFYLDGRGVTSTLPNLR